MNEDEARQFYLVRAIESEDRDHQLLTKEDRRQADASARRAIGSSNPAKPRTRRRYLAERSRFAAARLATRHPGIGQLLSVARWPTVLIVLVPLAALILGLVTNELGNGKRLDLLAVPLLGMIAWNLLAYLLLALRALRRGDSKGGASARLLGAFAQWRQSKLEGQSMLARAAGRFLGDWSSLSSRLTHLRTARMLHLGAACFALGVIAGIYLRALTVEYRAGWESTFLQADSVHGLLTVLLGPASALTGVAIPDVDGIARMSWSETPNGMNAAPWIYLYTATVLGLIVLPRLVLAGLANLGIWRIARRFPVPGREDFYTRRLLRTLGGTGAGVRITPYAYTLSRETGACMGELLRAALGDEVRLRIDEPVPYGEEDRWIARAQFDPDDEAHILLFSLSATPENENHGEMARLLATSLSDRDGDSALAILLDEAPYRAHFDGQSDLEQRLQQRRTAWEAVLADSNTKPMAVDLCAADIRGVAERLEATLLTDGAMTGGRA